MSALVIVKRGKASYPGFHLCMGGCRHKGTHAKDIGVKSAMYVALICGRPAAGLCESCAKAWKRDWEAARGPMQRRAVPVAQVADREAIAA